MDDHINLDADESDALIRCLVRAAEVGEDTGKGAPQVRSRALLCTARDKCHR